MKRSETGALGERIACDFLGENGYEILENNYRCPEGEIDIVARQAGTLVFVEVRTKKSRLFGSPEESITPAKRDKLRTLAQYYRQEHDNLPPDWRIDVVAIEMEKNCRITRIEIIENAVGEED
ncbi:MAG: YraN family protein [Dehalococcoidales bacterium]|nr:YraN family protein [Dehalococcoidales bacterium]